MFQDLDSFGIDPRSIVINLNYFLKICGQIWWNNKKRIKFYLPKETAVVYAKKAKARK